MTDAQKHKLTLMPRVDLLVAALTGIEEEERLVRLRTLTYDGRIMSQGALNALAVQVKTLQARVKEQEQELELLRPFARAWPYMPMTNDSHCIEGLQKLKEWMRRDREQAQTVAGGYQPITDQEKPDKAPPNQSGKT